MKFLFRENSLVNIFIQLILFMFFSCKVYAVPSVIDLLTNKLATDNVIVTVEPISGMTNEVTSIHLHFLTGTDCYSGYISGFRTDKTSPSFTAYEKVPFGLRADAVYDAAVASVRTTSITNIHSILVRLVSYERGNPYDRFARFTGSCQDQDVNCCVPVDCSEATRTCLPKHELPIQPIYWR
ncbi:MAG: hypothetical protein Q8R24_05675 [Legionellaceae bacterium]|nr:hypothetical protein [Legionellaceae bacterium]